MSAIATTALSAAARRRKSTAFLAANFGLLGVLAVAMAIHPPAEPVVALYVILLFLVCSAPLLFVTTIRGKFALLFAFLGFYFGTFGLQDLAWLVAGLEPVPPRPKNLTLFTRGEAGILLGCVVFTIGYVLVAAPSIGRSKVLTRDWSPSAVLPLALVCWAIGSFSNAVVQFFVGDRHSGVTQAEVYGAFGGFVSLFRVLGPLGTLMLIYSYLTTKRRSVLMILVATILVDFVLGFLGDSKETAFKAPVLFVFSLALLRERIPVLMLVVVTLVAGATFDFFDSYRNLLATNRVARAEAADQAGKNLEALAEHKPLMERFTVGLGYAASRITLKEPFSLILERTGNGVPFQDGYTLAPIFFAFIPRFVLPDKQDATETGLLFNDQFHLANKGVYISTSQNGELYWNFGWPGLLIGMLAMGMVLGYVALKCRLDAMPTLPKFLLLMLTVYVLILRFEGGLAMTYTYWARAVVLLLLIHLVVPKARQPRPSTAV